MAPGKRGRLPGALLPCQWCHTPPKLPRPAGHTLSQYLPKSLLLHRLHAQTGTDAHFFQAYNHIFLSNPKDHLRSLIAFLFNLWN